MSIKDLQKEVDGWIQNHGVRYFDVMTNTALLSEEVGELSGLLARVHGEQSFKSNTTEKPLTMIGDEMADVLFVLVCLANQLGVDLNESMKANLEKKTERDRMRHRQNPKLNN